MLNIIIAILYKINISRHISKHLVGENHTSKHHKVAGGCVMVVGVLIAKMSSHYELFVIHIVGDIIGYALHGIGLLPWVGEIEKLNGVNHKKEETTKSIIIKTKQPKRIVWNRVQRRKSRRSSKVSA